MYKNEVDDDHVEGFMKEFDKIKSSNNEILLFLSVLGKMLKGYNLEKTDNLSNLGDKKIVTALLNIQEKEQFKTMKNVEILKLDQNCSVRLNSNKSKENDGEQEMKSSYASDSVFNKNTLDRNNSNKQRSILVKQPSMISRARSPDIRILTQSKEDVYRSRSALNLPDANKPLKESKFFLKKDSTQTSNYREDFGDSSSQSHGELTKLPKLVISEESLQTSSSEEEENLELEKFKAIENKPSLNQGTTKAVEDDVVQEVQSKIEKKSNHTQRSFLGLKNVFKTGEIETDRAYAKFDLGKLGINKLTRVRLPETGSKESSKKG